MPQAERAQCKLEKLLAKHMLRRTKDSTIKDQLPTKTDNIVFCRLAPMQHRAYKCAPHHCLWPCKLLTALQ